MNIGVLDALPTQFSQVKDSSGYATQSGGSLLDGFYSPPLLSCEQ